MSKVILETRQNYRKYLEDLTKYCPKLREYKMINNLKGMDIHSTTPVDIIMIMSNLFLTEFAIHELIANNVNVGKIIIIMDNLTYYDSSSKTNNFQTINSKVLEFYKYKDLFIEPTDAQLREEAEQMDNLMSV